MFDKGKLYWVKLKTLNGTANLKGEVIEETPLLIKFKLGNGQEEVIPIVRILDINEAKEETNGK